MSKATRRSKKSLLEQIADISDPKPKDFDIENADLNDAANDQGSDSEFESDDEELRRGHYIEMGKSSLRQQQGIGNLGPKYTGSRTSRKELYGSDDDESDEEIESDNDNESLSEAEEDEERTAMIAQDSDDDGVDDSEDSDEGDSDGDMGFNNTAGAEAAQEQDRVREDIRKLEEGERALLQSITQTAKSDVEKGHHVLNQTRLWEGALDARIRVQKIVTAADELPAFDQFESLVESRFGNDTEADEINELEKARQSIMLLIGSLVELRRALAEQHPVVKKTIAGQKRKSDDDNDDDDEVEAMWSELEEARSGFQPFRDESLEKWGNKVQVSAGVTSSKKFKAVNQGIMHQISQALASEERLVERTQLKRTEYKIIGQSDSSDKVAAVADAHLKDRNPEIFDDTDFYQQLLRELIESRMVDSNDPTASLGVQWAAVKQQSKSKKHNVDTKASKGRKVRYHVIEKLQNFMPPIPAGSWHEDMVNELFSSLLGQQIPKNMEEEDSDYEGHKLGRSVTETMVNSGEISVGKDGMRLFG